MTNPIIIFEQDEIDQRDRGGRRLNEAFVREHLSYLEQEIEVVHEFEDDTVVIYQGFNEDGESWKFIQVK